MIATILRFPDTPNGLEWFREMAEDFAQFKGGNQRLMDIYRYLKWHHLANHTHPGSLEFRVAHGLALKYRLRIYGIEILEFERRTITEAERFLKASNAEIRKRKGILK